jgi:hypothetical protein
MCSIGIRSLMKWRWFLYAYLLAFNAFCNWRLEDYGLFFPSDTLTLIDAFRGNVGQLE